MGDSIYTEIGDYGGNGDKARIAIYDDSVDIGVMWLWLCGYGVMLVTE